MHTSDSHVVLPIDRMRDNSCREVVDKGLESNGTQRWSSDEEDGERLTHNIGLRQVGHVL